MEWSHGFSIAFWENILLTQDCENPCEITLYIPRKYHNPASLFWQMWINKTHGDVDRNAMGTRFHSNLFIESTQIILYMRVYVY